MWLIYSYCSIVTEATKYVPVLPLAWSWKRQIIQIHILGDAAKKMFYNHSCRILLLYHHHNGYHQSKNSHNQNSNMSWHIVASRWIDDCCAQLFTQMAVAELYLNSTDFYVIFLLFLIFLFNCCIFFVSLCIYSNGGCWTLLELYWLLCNFFCFIHTF